MPTLLYGYATASETGARHVEGQPDHAQAGPREVMIIRMHDRESASTAVNAQDPILKGWHGQNKAFASHGDISREHISANDASKYVRAQFVSRGAHAVISEYTEGWPYIKADIGESRHMDVGTTAMRRGY
ncbi:hypothetical protein B0H17DRAFT_1130449 [Mycena rosella]|uniref:Uncharacterized protein n=1 Tax=Mycena rosella TaxID=1033263 RepID=A0AAD7DRQ6_MYCRO|nr:hypothetical protein B0H17DRAFT_1130449 [Mycena rosella]